MKILLFKAHDGDPLSRAIESITQSPYCHAALLIDPDEPYRAVLAALCGFHDSGGDMICEEFWPEARARLLAPGELAQCDIFEIAGWTPDNETLALKWWADVIRGKVSYDAIDLPRFTVLGRLLLGSPDIGEEGAKRHMFCSDAVVVCARAAGRPVLNAPGCVVAPGQLPWSPLLIPAAP